MFCNFWCCLLAHASFLFNQFLKWTSIWEMCIKENADVSRKCRCFKKMQVFTRCRCWIQSQCHHASVTWASNAHAVVIVYTQRAEAPSSSLLKAVTPPDGAWTENTRENNNRHVVAVEELTGKQHKRHF